MKQLSDNQAGFTLIEIMIVMVIIGILAALSISGFRSSQTKARDAERKSDLKQIGLALETYYSDKGQYPQSGSSQTEGMIVGCGAGPTACTWGEAWVDDKGTIYMATLPSDARANLEYYYESDGNYYRIYAHLENELDYEVPQIDDTPATYDKLCGELMCNYGLASPNSGLGTVQPQ